MKKMKNLILVLALAMVCTTYSFGQTSGQTSNRDFQRATQFEAPPTVPRLSTPAIISAGSVENEALKKLLLESSANSTQLSGKRVAIVATDGVEELELTVPYKFVQERGASVQLVSPRYAEAPAKYGLQYPEMRKTHILTVRFMENAGWFKIDRFLDEAKIADYDAIIIPGGAWNPDTLRSDKNVIKFVTDFYLAGKLTTAICHGPQVLIDTGILKGKRATAYWNVMIDLKNAGANVSDEAVVVDGNLITSRFPYDLPQYLTAIADALTKADTATVKRQGK